MTAEVEAARRGRAELAAGCRRPAEGQVVDETPARAVAALTRAAA
ncbi:hypothetical protein AB0873_07115 [Micromonospora sp. NPDC047707]